MALMLGGCVAQPANEGEVVASQQAALTAGSGCYNTQRGSALRLRDEDSRMVPLPFAVDFYGNTYTSMWVNSNGNVTFDAANPSSANTTVPDGSKVLMAPLYGNLNPQVSISSDVFLNTVGSAPNRQVLITWWIVPEAGDTAANTFQLQLHESDGAIIFTYDSLNTDGINPDASPMNIGISSGAGQSTLLASGAAIPAFTGTATRFDWNGSDYGTHDGCDPPPDNTAPVADAGEDQVVECGDLTTLDGSGSFDVDGDVLTYAWSEDGDALASGETADVSFDLGTHVVDLTVDDGMESDTDSVTVTVEDTMAPALSMTVETTELWPPNHRMHTVVSGISAADGCCDAEVSISVSGGDDDDHEVVDNGDGTFDVRVRAERRGFARHGRTYEITVEAVDCAGNVSSEVVEVSVAHDRGHHRHHHNHHGHRGGGCYR